jgi:cobalt-zinc-cadmium efflux system outer membrane protein
MMRHLKILLLLLLIIVFALHAEDAPPVVAPAPDESRAGPKDGPSASAEIVTGPAEVPEKVAIPDGLTIEQAEALLIQNNLTIIAARYGVDTARATKIIADYHPNPSLLISGEQFQFNRVTVPGAVATPLSHLADYNPSASQRTYTFEFDLPLETAGKRQKRVDNAQAQLLSAEASVLDAVRNQIFQMKTFYYSAVLARENERVAAEVLESVDKTEALIQRQVKAGNTPESQLITFQANRIAFEQPLIAAWLAYEQAIRDLLNILSAKPEDVIGAQTLPEAKPNTRLSAIKLAGELVAEPVTANLQELRTKAEERSDVIIAKRNLEAAERNLVLTKAMRSPDVTVGPQFARVGGDNTAGLSFSLPLPLFNNKEGEIGQAEAQLRTARAALTQAKLQALTDVDKAFRSYELNLQVLQLYDDTAIKRAKEALDIAEKAYERGATSLLDVLDARRTYRQTLVARDQARFSLRQSIFQLEQAAGVKLSK